MVEGSDEEKAVDNKHKPRPTAAKAAASKVAPGGKVAPAGTNLDANDIGGKDGIGKGEKATSEGGKGKAGKGKDEEATSEGGKGKGKKAGKGKQYTKGKAEETGKATTAHKRPAAESTSAKKSATKVQKTSAVVVATTAKKKTRAKDTKGPNKTAKDEGDVGDGGEEQEEPELPAEQEEPELPAKQEEPELPAEARWRKCMVFCSRTMHIGQQSLLDTVAVFDWQAVEKNIFLGCKVKLVNLVKHDVLNGREGRTYITHLLLCLYCGGMLCACCVHIPHASICKACVEGYIASVTASDGKWSVCLGDARVYVKPINMDVLDNPYHGPLYKTLKQIFCAYCKTFLDISGAV